jgi:hypothetical protein
MLLGSAIAILGSYILGIIIQLLGTKAQYSISKWGLIRYIILHTVPLSAYFSVTEGSM